MEHDHPATAERRTHARLLAAWVLTGAIGVAAAVVWQLGVRHLDAPADEVAIPWWGLAVGFALVQSAVVHVHFRSETGTFDLLELPLVFALLFTDPSEAVLAVILGALVALAVVRRQPVLKVVFNIANLALHVGLAIVVFHHLLGGTDPLEPQGWVSILASTSIGAVVTLTTIILVVATTEGRFDARRVRNVALFGLVVSVANTSQGIIAALIVVIEPLAIPFLLCTATVLVAAYRAYVSEREQRERIEFLHSSTQTLRAAGHSNAAISTFVSEASTMFRASTVLVYLFPPVETEDPTALFIHRNGITTAESITREAGRQALGVAEAAHQPVRVVEGDGRSIVSDWLSDQGIGEAIVGALRSEKRIVGVLVVAERLGNVSTFTEADTRLFETLAQQAAVALENDQLDQALVQLRELGQQLEFQARTDGLTGLANRTTFAERLDTLLLNAGHNGTVLFVDLDDFKLVNDTYGHSAGDGLLCEVAQRISDCVRPSDTPARLGGDEFAVLLLDGRDAEAVAYRIVGALGAPYLIGGNEIRIGASVGLAHRSTARSGPQLLRHADLALYTAKERGKGTVAVYDESMDESANRQQELQSGLRRAIAEDEFEVHYQPIIRLDDLRIAGAEALVRWRQPSGRLALPAEFIYEAEQSGLILSVDRAVRTEVLRQLERFRRVDPEIFVSVNLSARHFMRPGLVDELAADILASGIPADALVLEITESVFVRDVTTASATLGELRELGVQLALDDFGTGYSSLSYLQHLPIDLLKIAQPFVADMDASDDTTFVSAINDLGHQLGFMMVAEGIETEQAHRMLLTMGCDLGQGFYFASPQPADAIEQLLTTRVSTAHHGDIAPA